jgi:hypothetical protein
MLEIIHLRSFGEPWESLIDLIRESVGSGEERTRTVRVYRQSGLSADLAVHIRHGRMTDPEGRSEMGLRLAASLRSYGLVKHTVWEELC